MSVRRSAVAVVSYVLLVCPFLFGQTSPFVEVLEVGLTNVDIVVTDSRGNPVPGLRPADFDVYEDGKRQDITHFSETRSDGASAFVLGEGGAATETATSHAPRKFIFYIDDSTLSLDNRRTVFPAVRKFLATHLRTGDEAMLVTWNRELNVRVRWTTDLAAMDRALETLAGEVSGAAYLHSEKLRAERLIAKMAEEANTPGSTLRVQWSELEYAARSYADAYQRDLTRSTRAMTRLLSSLAGVDGKKVLVWATDTLPTVAGAELFEHLENIRAAAAISDTSFLRPAAMSNSKVTNLTRYNVQPMVDALARAANATGVTVYGINPKGLGGPASGKTELQMPREVNIDFTANDQALAGINMLANRTGGVAMAGAPADLALARIGRDLDAYYSLGYRSTRGTTAERKIEVRPKRAGLHVRTRTNVFYRSLEREMADRVIANHLRSNIANDLGIGLESDPPVSDGSRRLLPVRVVIPVNMLTLLPDGDGNMTGGFSVFTCTGDGGGDASGVNVQSQALRFTAEQAAQLKGRRIGFAIQVPVDKARPQISIGVIDHVSQGQGFATLKASM